MLEELVEKFSYGEFPLSVGARFTDNDANIWIVKAVTQQTVTFETEEKQKGRDNAYMTASIQTTWKTANGELTWLGKLVDRAAHENRWKLILQNDLQEKILASYRRQSADIQEAKLFLEMTDEQTREENAKLAGDVMLDENREKHAREMTRLDCFTWRVTQMMDAIQQAETDHNVRIRELTT